MGPTPHGGFHGSASWFLAYHALLTVDYDFSELHAVVRSGHPSEPDPPTLIQTAWMSADHAAHS